MDAFPATTADFAWSDAQNAKRKPETLELRVAELENRLGNLERRVNGMGGVGLGNQ